MFYTLYTFMTGNGYSLHVSSLQRTYSMNNFVNLVAYGHGEHANTIQKEPRLSHLDFQAVRRQCYPTVNATPMPC